MVLVILYIIGALISGAVLNVLFGEEMGKLRYIVTLLWPVALVLIIMLIVAIYITDNVLKIN